MSLVLSTQTGRREQLVMLNTLYVILLILLDLCPTELFMSLGWDIHLAFKPYGDRWREERRRFHQVFNPSVIHQYRPRMMTEAGKLLKRLTDDPQRFMDHIRT